MIRTHLNYLSRGEKCLVEFLIHIIEIQNKLLILRVNDRSPKQMKILPAFDLHVQKCLNYTRVALVALKTQIPINEFLLIYRTVSFQAQLIVP